MTQNNIQVLSDVEFTGGFVFNNNYSDFPPNPQPRTLIVKDSIPYIYTELQYGTGFYSWQPMGLKQASYLHTQGVESTSWTVVHNFGSSDFGYFVYDAAHNLVIANMQIVDNNTITILLSQAMTGTVVLFSLQHINSTTVETNRLLIAGEILTVSNGSLLVSGTPVALTSYVDAQIANSAATAVTTYTALTGKPTTIAGFGISDAMTATAIASAIATETTRARASEALAAPQATTYTKTQIDSRIQEVIGAAPAALDTLAEIAAQLASDESAAAALVNTVSLQASKTYVDTALSEINSLTHDFSVNNLAVAGNILPAVTGVSTIGSPTDKFAAIYTKELHIDANTLYVDGVPVIGSSAHSIQITADVNQGMRIATTGTGQLILDSQTSTTVQTNGTNADVIIQAVGAGALARVSSSTQVVLTAPIVNIQGSGSISGDLTVAGNMTINGTTTAVNTTNMVVKDNIVTVNKGENGSGVSLRYAGFEIDRGDLARQRLAWDETVGKWVAGQTSQEVALATEPFVTAAIASATPSFATLTGKPTTLSGFGITDAMTATAITSAIASATPSFSTLTGKPTTLSGFGITDAMTATAITAAIGVETTARTAADALLAPQATTYTKTETDGRIQAVVGAAPIALDTLVEIAEQLASDESAAAALVTAVSLKAPQETTYTKTEVDTAISNAIAAFASTMYV